MMSAGNCDITAAFLRRERVAWEKFSDPFHLTCLLKFESNAIELRIVGRCDGPRTK
jgi:hypothetical protein